MRSDAQSDIQTGPRIDGAADGAARTVLTLTVDGAAPLSADTVAAVSATCRRAEDLRGGAIVLVHVSGAPQADRPAGLTTKLVNRWEQALRRLERVPATTIAVAGGDCGGPALDALLTTDHRIGVWPLRLVLPAQDGTVWPGMVVYRLARHAPGAAAIRRAMLFGGAITAQEAVHLHLIHELADDASAAVAAAIGRAAAVSGTELAVRRQLILDAQTVGVRGGAGHPPRRLRPHPATLRRGSGVVTTVTVPATPQPDVARLDLAAAVRALTGATGRATALLERLPDPADRDPGQRAEAAAAHAAMREVRGVFLQRPAAAVYAELTGGLTRPRRIDELCADAAPAFPGLVPGAPALAADRDRPQAAKEGHEIDQGLFIAALLRLPREGEHLLDAEAAE